MTEQQTAPAETRPRALEYQPALDGLRGVAVIAVLLFHGGFGWMSGGYLGVSLFFTLSGFLITTLLLAERERTSSVDLGSFYSRRIRRLLPASCVCLVGVIVAGSLGAFAGVADLRRDVTTSALQIANWGQLSAGRSYADLFRTGTSPLAHYWSLAIEEQFYLVWPIAFVGLFTLSKGSRRTLTILVAILTVGFAVAPLAIADRWGADAVYFATPARAGELFAGVLLALVLHRRSVPTWMQWPAVVAITAIVAAFVTTPSGHGWAYEGGLPVFAIGSAILIAGVQTRGPVRTMLSARPLVAIGTISYGVYLYHWPVFVLVDAHVDGLARPIAFALKVAITMVVAIASFVVIERPIRRARVARSRDVLAALSSIAAVVLVAILVTDGPASGTSAIDAQKAEAVAIRPYTPPTPVVPADPAPTTTTASILPGSTVAAAPTSVPAIRGPVKILLVGDSTALSLGSGLVDWAFDHPADAQVSVLAVGGCGLVHGGQFDTFIEFARANCEKLVSATIPAAIAEYHPDVVAVSVSVSDTWSRSWDGGATYLQATDPVYANHIATDYDAFFSTALANGAGKVVWLRPPVSALYNSTGKIEDPSFTNGGQDVIEHVVVDLSNQYPGRVQVLDYRSWLEGSTILDDPTNRPDDMHLTESAATTVSDEWLGPQLEQISRSG